jgi:small-conductance mechanosensitive channel
MEQLSELAGFPRAMAVAVALLGAIVVYRAIRSAIVALARQGHLNEVMEHRLTRVVRWGIVISTLLVVVQLIGVFENAWAVLSAFLATAAVAFFALWSVLSNVICSLMILFYRPFRLGDHIEIMDASMRYAGEVTDMNLMFTAIAEEGAENVIYIPNSLVFQRPLRCRGGRAPSKASFFGRS